MLAEVAKSLRDGESQGVPESLSVSREQVSCLISILGNLLSLLLELMAHKLVRANSYSIDLKSTLKSSLKQLPCKSNSLRNIVCNILPAEGETSLEILS